MPRDSAAADRPASYLVGTAAAFPLFFRDRTKPINQLPFSPSAKFPKSGSSCESRVNDAQHVGGGAKTWVGGPIPLVARHIDEADNPFACYNSPQRGSVIVTIWPDGTT